MRLDLDGEPIHVRAQSVHAVLRSDGLVEAHGSLLDLRTRGFLPVGGSMQGMGIIHHMELGWLLDPAARVVRQWTPSQPTVAFEASPETRGESCRDPIGAVATLADVPLGGALSTALRDGAGGARGCSHLVTLGLFMDAAARAAFARRSPEPSSVEPRPLWRRDLVFDAHGGFWFTDFGKTRRHDMDWGCVCYAKADGSTCREVIRAMMAPNSAPRYAMKQPIA